MAIFYLNTIPLLPPLYLSLWCDLLLFKSLAISLCLLSQYWLYQQFIIYYITILLPITLFINYISKKKEFFSTPCKERRKKKFLLVQELSRTFLINTYSPSLVLFFTIFSYCKPLWCSSNWPLGSLGGRRLLRKDQVSKVSKWLKPLWPLAKDSLPFPAAV